jgi:hypothetical protein
LEGEGGKWEGKNTRERGGGKREIRGERRVRDGWITSEGGEQRTDREIVRRKMDRGGDR